MMANSPRQILTTLAVDGEAEFKRAMDTAYSSMRVLNSELRENAAEYDGDAKSMEGLTRKSEILQSKIAQQKEIVAALTRAVSDASTAYGENDQRTDAYRIKLNNAQAALSGMERSLKTTNSEMDKGAYSTQTLAERMEKIATSCQTAGARIQGIGEKVSVISGAATAAGAAIVKFTTSSGKMADELITTSNQTGVSTQTLQKWTYAAKFVDTEVDTMTKGLGKVTKAMGTAAGKNQDYIELSNGLQVAIRGSNGELLSSEEVFYNAIDALGRMSNETERDIATQELFGKSFQDMNPLIKAGSGELKKLGDEAQNAGLIMSDQGVAALGAFDDSMERMSSQADAAKNNLALAFAPAIEDVVTQITDAIQGFSDWIKTLDESQVQTVITIAAVTAATGPLIVGIGKVVEGVGSLATTLPTLLASPVAPILLGITAAGAGVAVVVDAMNAGSRDFSSALRDGVTDLDTYNSSLSGLKSTLPDVSGLLSDTGHSVSDMDALIKTSEDAITGILSTALQEHRDLRASELEDIRKYNEELLNLNTEKLNLYRDQQIAEMQKIYLAEQDMTRDQAEQQLVNAKAAFDASNQVAEDAYTAQLVQIENFYRTRGELGSQDYLNAQQQAKQYYEGQTVQNSTYYKQSLSALATASVNWIADDSDRWSKLKGNAVAYSAALRDTNGVNAANWDKYAARTKMTSEAYAATFKEVWDSVNLESAQGVLKMVATAQSMGAPISDAARQAVSDLLFPFTTLSPKMEEGGKQALLGLLGGMEGQFPDLKDASKMTASDIVTAIKNELDIHSPSKVMNGIGQNVVQGLEDGMESKKTDASRTASGIGAQLVKTFKDIFGIHSPSRVMKEQIGRYLPLGVAQGIEENAWQVRKAFADMLPDQSAMELAMNVTRNFNDVADDAILSTTVKRETRSTLDLSERSIGLLARDIAAASGEKGDIVLTLNNRELARYVRQVSSE